MTFVIRSRDRRRNYDVLCEPGSAGYHGKNALLVLNFPAAALNAIHDGIKS